MNKSEFLKQLKESLKYNFTNDFIDEKIEYYDNYIKSEIKNGRSESDIINELGDPRLIAKTLEVVNKNTKKTNVPFDNIENDKKTEYQKKYSDNSFSQYFRIYNFSCLTLFIIFLILFFIVFYLIPDLIGLVFSFIFANKIITLIIILIILYTVYNKYYGK